MSFRFYPSLKEYVLARFRRIHLPFRCCNPQRSFVFSFKFTQTVMVHSDQLERVRLKTQPLLISTYYSQVTLNSKNNITIAIIMLGREIISQALAISRQCPNFTKSSRSILKTKQGSQIVNIYYLLDLFK